MGGKIMKARTAFHRNHGKAIAMLKKDVLNGLGHFETKLDSGSEGITNAIALTAAIKNEVTGNKELINAIPKLVETANSIKYSLAGMESTLHALSDGNTGIPSGDQIENIFSCIKVINRLEDILLDKNFPKMPNELCSKVITQNSSDTLTGACCGKISTHGVTLKTIFEDVIAFCKDIESSKQKPLPSEEEKFKKRFEFFQRLQALRKEIIVHLSKQPIIVN